MKIIDEGDRLIVMDVPYTDREGNRVDRRYTTRGTGRKAVVAMMYLLASEMPVGTFYPIAYALDELRWS